MEYRNLGNSGVKVSEVGLGTFYGWGRKISKEKVARVVHSALDHGINFIDTANIYGPVGGSGISEEYLGEALQGHRHDVVIATKGYSRMGPGPNDMGASRYHLIQALEGSLRRLRTDHVDLYQIHFFDETTPMEETMRALDEMVRSGKVRYIGASNYQSWQVCRSNDLAERYGWERFITIQSEYNMLNREIEREILPYCRAFNMGILPYCPLAEGFLTGLYKQGAALPPDSRIAVSPEKTRRYFEQYGTPENVRIIGLLSAWAAERGHAMVELAIAWLLGEPMISSIIAGADKVAYVETNVRASEWKLTVDERAEIRTILEGTEH